MLLDTAIAYIAVLRDTRILAARDAQLVAIQRIAAFTDKQFELNDATRTDVALARSAFRRPRPCGSAPRPTSPRPGSTSPG